jgi:hypothetical protein
MHPESNNAYNYYDDRKMQAQSDLGNTLKMNVILKDDLASIIIKHDVSLTPSL